MIDTRTSWLTSLTLAAAITSTVVAQEAGSIRGVVSDADFEVPLGEVTVRIVQLDLEVTATEQGNYLFLEVPPGVYTLQFSKAGYETRPRANVLVQEGQSTEVDIELSGDFTDLEEYVVEDIQLDAGGEVGLLQQRLEAAALIDSVSADLLSRAGFSDAASALNLVSGATVQDGKFAVIRGLPDRYVNSQLNGIRLPTADEDKRAVQLDQFPSAVIDTIQISKTFTPDQQGDASGGAVNVLLRGIPDQNIFKFKAQYGYNSQVKDRSDFLTYEGGGVNFWGNDDGKRNIPPLVQDPDDPNNLIRMFGGAAGLEDGNAPQQYKWSLDIGGRHEFDGITVGGFASFFYERDSSFYDNGVDDSYWVTTPGEGLVPETDQGFPSPNDPQDGDFLTSLFDVTKSSETVQWGGLGTFGLESEYHDINITYLYTRIAEDEATLATDTRGKEYFFPGHDPYDNMAQPNRGGRDAAPFIRTQTIAYTERTTETLQLRGRHTIPTEEFGIEDVIIFGQPELDWSLSGSEARLYQPDKRQFGAVWKPAAFNPGFPPFIPPFVSPSFYAPYKPAAVFTLGNFQRIWKEISEESEQRAVNLKFPFTQWSENEGYFKFGVFDDEVTRHFNQDTFSNFNDNSTYEADWSESWSGVFPFQDHPISDGPPYVDVDYDGFQNIKAWYWMVDMPVNDWLNFIGGYRYETTEIGIINIPEEDATWFPPGSLAPVALTPGAADVSFEQDDELPSIGFVLRPMPNLQFRGSYTETVARQTYKELTPIQQQEFLGGDVFIGNPELGMSSLRNYDLRLDYTPYDGGLVSVSWFSKDIDQPIEYVQRVVGFTFTTPVNYPEGQLSGWELEVRHDFGQTWEGLQGLRVGANATFINSEVTLPEDEALRFEAPSVMAPMRTRDMTNAPEHLFNVYATWDIETTGTQLGLFYTVKGDTLIAGAGESDGNFVPSVYAREFGTLNFSLAQKLGEHLKLQFQAKNLTDPIIEEVYRSEYIGDDVRKTSYTKGIDYSISLSAEFTF